ncbi:MAG: acetyl-CoA carboxylase, biotin carboxyl carrier protein [Bacteroidetes bacterium RIFCSPLOWO2_12_FULL_35_15]|nr:MAG: acetyl-CoA carboxylase, biotin carboxyl carrier protein [Bacteroidetes bacterium RIFCSPLOWO2_12_FULL_35_15]
MKLNEIQDLIKFVAKSGVSEVELETKDVKIIIKTPAGRGKEQVFVQPVTQPVAQVAAPVTQQVVTTSQEIKTAEPVVTSEEAKYITVKSPMIGTFYRSSSPDKPSFVNVGDDIDTGKVICIIEAMKLFNEIESEVKGKIVKVLVNDATPVEYDQPLFLVDPS